MSDLIDRDDAIMAVKVGALSAATIYGRTDEGSTALYETIRAIKAIPSAQPEIRCKDCKYRGRFGYCTYGTRLAWIVGNDDYCSKGERRQDG